MSYLKSEDCALRKKLCFNNKSICYQRSIDDICIVNEVLSETHSEADPIILFHVVFAGSFPNEVIYVICDDTWCLY